MDERSAPGKGPDGFERLARSSRRRSGAVGEFLYFLRRTRKWWMAPIIVSLLLIAGILVMSTSAVAPLIYALF